MEEAERLLAGFDRSRVDARTDREIVEAARNDPDPSLPGDEDLREFDLVLPALARGGPLDDDGLEPSDESLEPAVGESARRLAGRAKPAAG